MVDPISFVGKYENKIYSYNHAWCIITHFIVKMTYLRCNFDVNRKKLPAPPALEAILNIHYTQRNYLVWIKLSRRNIETNIWINDNIRIIRFRDIIFKRSDLNLIYQEHLKISRIYFSFWICHCGKNVKNRDKTP